MLCVEFLIHVMMFAAISGCRSLFTLLCALIAVVTLLILEKSKTFCKKDVNSDQSHL